jgi:hypothetical protein
MLFQFPRQLAPLNRYLIVGNLRIQWVIADRILGRVDEHFTHCFPDLGGFTKFLYRKIDLLPLKHKAYISTVLLALTLQRANH